MTSVLQDIRYSLRMMGRNRAFTIVAVATLAVGLATATTVFSWIDAVMLRPLPGVAEPERLVSVETLTPNGASIPNSYPDYRDFRDHLRLLSGIAVSRPVAFSVGREDHAERVWGEMVSGNFFAVLGVKPALGRVFLPSEYGDKPGAFPVAVISDSFWRSHYNADPGVAGKTIRVNQHELTIVGVTAPGFHGSMAGEGFDVWVPYMMQPQLNGVEEWMLRDRGDRNMLGFARLKPGVTMEQARDELVGLYRRMAVADADMDQGMSATLLPLWKSHFGPQTALLGPLLILSGMCLVVLLIACVNVANLLLARSASRQKEFSTRLALGAGRARLAQQILTESLLLALAGALVGLAATNWLSRAVVYLLPPGQMYPLALDLQLNGHVLAFAMLVCLLTALLAGLVPALQSVRADLNEKLNDGGRSGAAGARSHRLRSSLVAAEVSLALVALIAAGLFTRGFAATSAINPGFDPNHVLLSQFYLSTSGYNLDQRKEFCRRLEEKVDSAPGVVSAAYSDGVPLGFEPSWWEDLNIEGYVPARAENMKIFRNVISPGYLPLMKIPIVAGRNFTEHDDEKSQLAMIVNQTFARHFFGESNPIGRRVHGWGEWFTVVGVAKDSKYHSLSETAVPYFYVPFRQVYRADMNLAFYVRTGNVAGANAESALAMVRQKVREIDPNVTVFDAVPLAEYIGASLYPQKLAASLLGVMGLLAVLLAAVGLYSVMAYSVVQRTQEIGIRMALGARPVDVLNLVVRQGLKLASLGLAAGIVLALAMSRVMASVSFSSSAMGSGFKLLGDNATDPLIYAGAVIFLLSVAALAAFVPARRAASVEPMAALRCE